MAKFKQLQQSPRSFKTTTQSVQKQRLLKANTDNLPLAKATAASADRGKIPELLLEELRCPVCYEVLNHAKSLSKCLHTFCQPCLEKMITGRNKFIHCPLCRKKTPLPYRGVRFLPTNSVVVRLLDRFVVPKTTRDKTAPVVLNVVPKSEALSNSLKKFSQDLEKDVRKLEQNLRKKERKYHKDVQNVVQRYKKQTKNRQKGIKRLQYFNQ